MEEQKNVMIDTILRRRTARKFLKKPVPKSVIEDLLQMAMFAPTRLGKRPWHFIVIQDSDVKARLVKSLQISPEFADAPAFIAVTGEKGVSETWDLDAAAATQNLLIAATGSGIASAWIAGMVNPAWDKANDVFVEAIQSPKEVALVALVAIGYPAEELPAHTPAEVYEQHRAHFERWGNTVGDS